MLTNTLIFTNSQFCGVDKGDTCAISNAVSLYVKGFGAAAVHEIFQAAMKNLLYYLIVKFKIMKQQTSAVTETYIKGRNIIDFTGKTIYVGIDVHQKDYQVAKVHEGVCLGNHRMISNSEALIEHLRNYYPGADFKCVYEDLFIAPC